MTDLGYMAMIDAYQESIDPDDILDTYSQRELEDMQRDADDEEEERVLWMEVVYED